jgi:hypothetical protein
VPQIGFTFQRHADCHVNFSFLLLTPNLNLLLMTEVELIFNLNDVRHENEPT